MSICLADNVQVRHESWGLLFYRPAPHWVCFVKSGNWLKPAHFDGSWTYTDIISEISQRTGISPEIVERSVSSLTDRLLKNQVIINEIR
jgi:hypothetical protein